MGSWPTLYVVLILESSVQAKLQKKYETIFLTTVQITLLFLYTQWQEKIWELLGISTFS